MGPGVTGVPRILVPGAGASLRAGPPQDAMRRGEESLSAGGPGFWSQVCQFWRHEPGPVALCLGFPSVKWGYSEDPERS